MSAWGHLAPTIVKTPFESESAEPQSESMVSNPESVMCNVF
jgi:hypothetical protein